MSRNPGKKLCNALTASGQPCRSYAMSGSDRCRSHRHLELGLTGAGAPEGNDNARTHGLYSPRLDPDDFLAMALTVGDDLADEVAFARIMVRKFAGMIDNTTDTEIAVKLGRVLFAGLGRIALLLKAHQALTPERSDAVTDVIAGALDELGAEYDLDL